MRLGIIGLPQSGKTTIFNALTRGSQPTGAISGKMEVHTSVVDVPDNRVDDLAVIFKPRKIVYAKVTYADIAGLDGNASKNGIAGTLLNQLAQMDGFIHVVRAFENENVPHLSGSIDPHRDLAMLDGEFILNDLISVERRLERLEEERRKGGGRDKNLIDQEMQLFQKFYQALGAETPLRDLELAGDEMQIVAGFGFLTLKPVLILLNIEESQDEIRLTYPHQQSKVVSIKGKLEMDLAQLPAEEAFLFMSDYGIDELSLDRIIQVSYDLLGLQSFFTVGEDEVRAWTVQRGATAPEAAGKIHTDLQKGFIRAEVIQYADLMQLGGMTEARAKGKLRLEGKEYIVLDGDILTIRFSK